MTIDVNTINSIVIHTSNKLVPSPLSFQVIEENPDPATTLLTFLRYQNQCDADIYFYLDSNQ